jgi:hypothetical protein
MRQAATRQLLSYWEGLREGRSAAMRTPADSPSAFATMRAALSDTFLLDVDPARAFPICAAGGRLNSLLLSPGLGAPFIKLWTPEQQDRVADLFSMVCDDFTPAVATVWAAPKGADPVALEMLLLPLRRGPGHATLLGGLSPGAVPKWYGHERVQPLRLAAWRLLHCGARTHGRRTVRERFVLIQGGRMDLEAAL